MDVGSALRILQVIIFVSTLPFDIVNNEGQDTVCGYKTGQKISGDLQR